jgi:signal peptidase I
MKPTASKHSLSLGRRIFYTIVFLCSSVLLFFFYARGMTFFKVPSRSMEPTFLPGDFILTLKEPDYRRGDVVVVHDPIESSTTAYDVKRIIAVGGDTVEIKWGAVMINGSYVSEQMYMKEPIEYDDMPAYKVPQDEIFLLGDNRNQSADSSVWPQKSIPVKDIVGKVQLIYLPFSRCQFIRHYPIVNTQGK